MEIVPLAGDKKSYKYVFSSKTLSFRFMEILSIVWCIKFNGKKKLYSIPCYWIILKYLPINFRHGVRIFPFFWKIVLKFIQLFLSSFFYKSKGSKKNYGKSSGFLLSLKEKQ